MEALHNDTAAASAEAAEAASTAADQHLLQKTESGDDWSHFDEDSDDGYYDFFGESRQHHPINNDHENDNEIPVLADPMPTTTATTAPTARNSAAVGLSANANANNNTDVIQLTFPPQLHPAVSLGVRRVSSCYFSLASSQHSSVADLLSQIDSDGDFMDVNNNDDDYYFDDGNGSEGTNHHQQTTSKTKFDRQSSNVLYHDILMHVFTYLDAPSLGSFSETARRPNFEVFYFLQLQLQRALLVEPHKCSAGYETENVIQSKNQHNSNDNYHIHDDPLSSIAGASYVSRLAQMDAKQAKETVEEYVRSNSTLHTMPLSHSIAYMRQVLQRHGFHTRFMDDSGNLPPSHALASAALLMAFVGAASLMAAGDAASFDYVSFGSELPNMLFRVGFVGSLMGAARQVTDKERRTFMRRRAERMAETMQNMSTSLLHANPQGDSAADTNAAAAADAGTNVREQNNSNFRMPSLSEMGGRLATRLVASGSAHSSTKRETITDENLNVTNNLQTESKEEDDYDDQSVNIVLSNPYDHLSDVDVISEEKKDPSDGNRLSSSSSSLLASSSLSSSKRRRTDQKVASGCVGAYSRAVARAAKCVTQLIKERRRNNFLSLSVDEQEHLIMSYFEACSSDDSLELVKELTDSMDVDMLHVAMDGSETCALHTAAFSGATKVLDFLCEGIDDNSNSTNDVNDNDNNSKNDGTTQSFFVDGGLCDVNFKDTNGWTALHFAAGANSVGAVQILVNHGADLQIQANNGYSPLQWAIRLSNDEVAEELKRLEAKQANERRTNRTGGQMMMRWIGSQPLTSIANRFFGFIPVAS